MRILQVGKYYPPVKGGMETVLRLMCEGLLARGHAVSALVAGTRSEDRIEALPGSVAGGGSGRLVRAASLAVINSQPVVPSLMSLLRRELALLQPDIVQLHLPNPAACAACLAVLAGRDGTPRQPRLAVWYHADITRQRLGRWLVHPLVAASLKKAAGIAVSSAALRNHSPLLQPHLDKVRVIPFGIAGHEWEAIHGAEDGPFLFIGRLVYYKGVSILLEAARRLPEARIVIVGDGPLRAQLEAEVRAAGLNGRVRFTGQLEDERLRSVMQQARALVLPSVDPSETFGLVQLEAMAAGLPVISSDLPTGVAEVNLDGITGRVVTPGDADDLTRAMAEMLADPKLATRWGDAGRERVRQQFSSEQMISHLVAWYEALLQDRMEGTA